MGKVSGRARNVLMMEVHYVRPSRTMLFGRNNFDWSRNKTKRITKKSPYNFSLSLVTYSNIDFFFSWRKNYDETFADVMKLRAVGSHKPGVMLEADLFP